MTGQDVTSFIMTGPPANETATTGGSLRKRDFSLELPFIYEEDEINVPITLGVFRDKHFILFWCVTD